jgi:hypothetical protein
LSTSAICPESSSLPDFIGTRRVRRRPYRETSSLSHSIGTAHRVSTYGHYQEGSSTSSAPDGRVSTNGHHHAAFLDFIGTHPQ